MNLWHNILFLLPFATFTHQERTGKTFAPCEVKRIFLVRSLKYVVTDGQLHNLKGNFSWLSVLQKNQRNISHFFALVSKMGQIKRNIETNNHTY